MSENDEEDTSRRGRFDDSTASLRNKLKRINHEFLKLLYLEKIKSVKGEK